MIERVAPFILVIASLVWAVSVLLDAAPGLDYQPEAYVHQVMLGVVGIIALAYGVKKKGNNGK